MHRQCNDDVGWEDYVYASPPADGSKLQHGSGLRRDLLGWYDCGLTTHADCGYDGCVAINRLFEGPGAPFSWKPLENHYERFKFVADVDGCVCHAAPCRIVVARLADPSLAPARSAASAGPAASGICWCVGRALPAGLQCPRRLTDARASLPADRLGRL